MISTLYFIILIAFRLWYLTSAQVKHTHRAGYPVFITRDPQRSRSIGAGLLVLASALFIVKLGWMSGIMACIVSLMGVGSLVITLAPFHYMKVRTVVLLYLVFLILELSI